MSRSVVLPGAVRRALIRHAREAAPRECCGLLVGTGRRIQFAVAMRNVSTAPRTRFRLSAREHLAFRRSLRQFSPSLEIVGAYHSHPEGPGRPSARDLAEAHYPAWIWLIVGRRSMSAFRIRNGQAFRLRFARATQN